MVIKLIHIISVIFSGFFLIGKACDGRSCLLAHTGFRTGAFYAENNQSKEKFWKKKLKKYLLIWFFFKVEYFNGVFSFLLGRRMSFLVSWIANYFMKDKIYQCLESLDKIPFCTEII